MLILDSPKANITAPLLFIQVGEPLRFLQWCSIVKEVGNAQLRK